MESLKLNRYICFSDEVRKALDEHKSIVAIETGGTFEGIPYPENASTALCVMDRVRKAGATPAYISIMDGQVKVGMTEQEIIANSIKDKISGKAITGYLMKYVKDKMGSDSMEVQKHMIIQNAVLAAEVASKLCV